MAETLTSLPAAGDISKARAEAQSLAATLSQFWAVRVYAPARTDICADYLAEARAAMERLNASAVALGIAAPVLRFPDRGENFANGRPADADTIRQFTPRHRITTDDGPFPSAA